MNCSVFAAVVAVLVQHSVAFSGPHTFVGDSVRRSTALFMSEENPVSITATGGSGKKEISYDEKSGRFFETGTESAECIPNDEYCVVDKASGKMVRLTVQEKERIFLDSLQAYYVSGRQLLEDQEFDMLKEDLEWNGSPLVTLNRKETRYLAALQAYLKGESIMSDSEFDTLKRELKEDESPIAVSVEPKCYIDTGICTVTLLEDNFRTNLLYLPMGAILFIAWLGVGFEIIEPLIRLNPIILLALGAYPIYKYAIELTDKFIFVNNKIAYGPCPSCESPNRIYFGDILTIEGFGDTADVKCKNCKTTFQVQKNTLRASTLPK